MMPDHLQDMFKRIRSGDRAAFRKLVEMYQQPAYRLAFRILGNEEEARDAVQETFIKIWQKIGSYDPSREFLPWMYRILANTATDRFRTLQRHEMISLDKATPKLEAMLRQDPSASADNREMALLIKNIAEILPEKQKLVFLLRDIEGMTSVEVEAITDLDETSVKSNLYHARKKVREHLLKILEKERMMK
jgi:RNA polymerase sigma-70 factor (ECF subfamily)